MDEKPEYDWEMLIQGLSEDIVNQEPLEPSQALIGQWRRRGNWGVIIQTWDDNLDSIEGKESWRLYCKGGWKLKARGEERKWKWKVQFVRKVKQPGYEGLQEDNYVEV